MNVTKNMTDEEVAVYHKTFWGVSLGLSGCIVIAHVVLYFVMRRSENSCIEKIISYYKGLTVRPTVEDIVRQFDIEYDIVDNEEDIQRHSTSPQISKRYSLFKILFNRERPMIMDIVRYFGIIFVFFGVLLKPGAPWMIVSVSVFYVPYDITYFVFGIFHACTRSQDPNKLKRTGQMIIALVYSFTGGMPLGLASKITLALWYDGYVTIDIGMAPYLVLIVGIASVLPFLALVMCVCGCYFWKKYTHDLYDLIITKRTHCFFWAAAVIMCIVFAIFIGMLISIYGIMKLTNAHKTLAFLEKIDFINLESAVTSSSRNLLAIYFLVIWIPAVIVITALLIVSYWYGVFSLYVPDYFSFWCLFLSSCLLCYNIDYHSITGSYWINDGTIFIPLWVDIIFGVGYYGYYCFIRNRLLEIVDEESIKRHGIIYLVNVPTTDQRFDEISNLMQNTFDKHKVGYGRDAQNQTRRNVRITRIGHLVRTEIPYNHAWIKYNNGKNRVTQKQLECNITNMRKLEDLPGSNSIQIATMEQLNEHSVLLEELNTDINECYLWHGTERTNAGNICLTGFDMGKATRAAYGKAVYLAEKSSKADQYTDSGTKKIMFLVRTCLGSIWYDTRKTKFTSAPCKLRGCNSRSGCKHDHQPKYDSVCMDPRSLYREFLVFEDSQCYPEYMIEYDTN